MDFRGGNILYEGRKDKERRNRMAGSIPWVPQVVGICGMSKAKLETCIYRYLKSLHILFC